MYKPGFNLFLFKVFPKIIVFVYFVIQYNLRTQQLQFVYIFIVPIPVLAGINSNSISCLGWN